MSRHDARRRITARQLRREMREVWYNERIGSRLCEESPSAYKDIDTVMENQADLVEVVATLKQVVCIKG